MKKKQQKPRTIYQKKRKEAKLTQETAAEKLDLSSRTIQLFEAGTREPKLSMGFKMADLYGCSIEDFRPKERKEKEEATI